MTKASADRMTVFVAALGLATTLAYLFASGQSAAMSSGIGAAVALTNFLLLRAIVVRVVEGDMHRKLPFIGLIFFKMGGLMFIVYWAIAHRWVAPIPFTLGMSSLVVGLIVSSLLAVSAASESGTKSASE